MAREDEKEGEENPEEYYNAVHKVIKASERDRDTKNALVHVQN